LNFPFNHVAAAAGFVELHFSQHTLAALARLVVLLLPCSHLLPNVLFSLSMLPNVLSYTKLKVFFFI